MRQKMVFVCDFDVLSHVFCGRHLWMTPMCMCQRGPLESGQAGADVNLTSIHTGGDKYGTVVNIYHTIV